MVDQIHEVERRERLHRRCDLAGTVIAIVLLCAVFAYPVMKIIAAFHP